jgi:hypothetical protein
MTKVLVSVVYLTQFLWRMWYGKTIAIEILSRKFVWSSEKFYPSLIGKVEESMRCLSKKNR